MFEGIRQCWCCTRVQTCGASGADKENETEGAEKAVTTYHS